MFLHLSSTSQLTRLVVLILFAQAFLISSRAEKNAPKRDGKPDSIPLSIFLSAASGRIAVHDSKLPLLLHVTIAAPQLYNSRYLTDAQRARGGSSQPAGNKRPPPAVQSIVIGTTTKPVSQAISFEVRNAKGELLQLRIRPLATTMANRSITVTPEEGQDFSFGIDAVSMSGIAPGNYMIKAILEGSGEENSWRGRVESDVLNLELKSGDLTKEQKYTDILQAGRFFLYDQDYARVEEQAASLLQLDGLSASAWELRGDAFVAQNKLDDAEKAYIQALNNAQERGQPNVPPPLQEQPDHLYRRLARVQELRERGR